MAAGGKHGFGFRAVAQAILRNLADRNGTEWEGMRVLTRSAAEHMGPSEILTQSHAPESTRYVVEPPDGTTETIRWREDETAALANIIARHYRWEPDA